MAKYETIAGRLVPHTKQGRPTKGVTFPDYRHVDPGERTQDLRSPPGAPGSAIEGEGKQARGKAGVLPGGSPLADSNSVNPPTAESSEAPDKSLTTAGPPLPSPTCELCGTPIEVKAKGRKRKYCSTKCRFKAARQRKGGKRDSRRGSGAK